MVLESESAVFDGSCLSCARCERAGGWGVIHEASCKSWNCQRFTDNMMLMRVHHADRKLERLEAELTYSAGFGREVVKAFRKRMAFIRAAVDERAFYSMKSLHYEKLKGERAGQRSMRLNEQFRLVLRIEATDQKSVVAILSVEDYH